MNNTIKMKTADLNGISFFISKISTSENAIYEKSDGENYKIDRQLTGIVEYQSTFDGKTLSLSFGWVAGASGDSFANSFNYEFDFCSDLGLESNFIITDYQMLSHGEVDEDDVNFIQHLIENSQSFENWQEHSLFDADESTDDLNSTTCNLSDEFEEITLDRVDSRGLKFKGELIADASSKSSFNNVKWEELALYKANTGEYVCQKLICSIMGGYDEYSYVSVVKDEKDIKSFYGDDETALELYELAEI